MGLLLLLIFTTVLSGCGKTQYSLVVTVDGSGAVAPDPGSVFQAPSKAAYSENEPVTLMAMSTAGWAFDHWTGDLVGNTNPTTIVMDTNKAIAAVFTKLQYALAVDVEPAGAGTVFNVLTSYEHGQTVQLTANAAAGWVFDHWIGDLSGTDNPGQIEMTGPKTMTAVFRKAEHDLTVNVSPAGAGTVQTGLILPARSVDGVEDGGIVKMTAVPDTGYVFDHWEGALTGSDNPATLTVDGPKTVTAVFVKRQYNLVTSVEPAGTGSISEALVEAARSYAHGQTVRLTANAADGWEFDHWVGDLAGTISPADLEMTGPKTVTAVFRKKDYDLTVTVSPAGAGTIKTVTLVQTRVLHGETVQLTAAPNAGYLFDHWEGDLTGDVNPSMLTVDGAKTVTAVFVPWQTVDPPMRNVPGPITCPLGGYWNPVFMDHAFLMAETEVTYEKWYAVRIWALNHGYQFANTGREGDFNNAVGTPPSANKRHPVTCVSWCDAIVWCNALTEYYNRQYGTDLICVYTYGGEIIRNANDATACNNVQADTAANGFRLPTSDEWELAARYIIDANGDGILGAGEYYPDDHVSGDVTNPYQSSVYLGSYAWHEGNSDMTTHPVAFKAPNALGIYDMGGNVNEWCFGGIGAWRDFRGGSYSLPAACARVNWGANTETSTIAFDRGFRVARNQ